jgi:hypothetical protein
MHLLYVIISAYLNKKKANYNRTHLVPIDHVGKSKEDYDERKK